MIDCFSFLLITIRFHVEELKDRLDWYLGYYRRTSLRRTLNGIVQDFKTPLNQSMFP
jgi:hypothetical protein